ncbi:GntR family transcriptional regulator [Halarsenatibacter silvermanii]|uniref:DNA-binding transcriptional regulator, GntR family n=1 Tax=Halarsenatibacter silvermanii TaxID=321763 RepID=A0A1G9R0X3_9FIRM|nr:GntR family transcriptional regulator [Halarsenatibacter silvermanii]SDM16781.1 DNA-binding transcriptional regulator, GntR family [Halarsenatibacter silvermanii]
MSDDLNLPPLDSYSYKPLRKQIYENLRESILDGILKPGEKITEMEIASELDVSRTPVREAIQMLELENLVAVVPKRGIFIAGIKSKKEINDLFQVRAELEGLAAYLAAREMNQEILNRLEQHIVDLEDCLDENELDECVEIEISFHQIIYDTADNIWLKKMLDNLFEQINRFRSSSLDREGRMRQTLEELRELVEALREEEPEKARARAREHIEQARKSIIEVFDEVYDEE